MGTWRGAHGRARELGSTVVIEVPPPDELPSPVVVVDRIRDEASRVPRDQGRLIRGQAEAMARLGGKSKGGRPSLVSTLGLSKDTTPDVRAFDVYRRRANSFRRAHCESLALLAGGECGTGPSSLVATASIQLAVSRYLYDAATRAPTPDLGVLKEARMQGDSSRQNLLAAYELAVREAQRRGKKDVDPLDVIEAKQRATAHESQLNHPHDGLT